MKIFFLLVINQICFQVNLFDETLIFLVAKSFHFVVKKYLEDGKYFLVVNELICDETFFLRKIPLYFCDKIIFFCDALIACHINLYVPVTVIGVFLLLLLALRVTSCLFRLALRGYSVASLPRSFALCARIFGRFAPSKFSKKKKCVSID